MEDKVSKLQKLKEEHDAVILAHYYATSEVQEIADYIGDSFYLATLARNLDNKVIVLAGVYFMAESAKVLSPDKTVLIPDETAGCPMADMATVEGIQKVRSQYDDLAVVCYVNSNADLKAHSDVCVTSSNAVNIVSKLKEKNIYFVPDKNLAHYISTKLPEKNFIFNDGFCCVHEGIWAEEVKAIKEAHPGVKVLMHPECTAEALTFADYIGATSGILDYATSHDDSEFIIATEVGILHQLKKHCPEKTFYTVNDHQICNSMKKNTLDSILNALEHLTYDIKMDGELMEASEKPLTRMVELANA
ncbi:MAG: quinolinate synthase NadA [Clostridiales Family XIII bacterium]|jgi:quinolinate synthase|nr:quinolinate synthase NadA [Clostridiales Family XIII bacterium]